MRLNLSHLVSALDQFPAYHAIDVFADDLAELREHPLPASLRQVDTRSFLFSYRGTSFTLEIFPDQGVARLSKDQVSPVPTGALGGAVVGGLIGAAVDAAGKQKGAGLLGGVLLGLLVGASLSGTGDARRVFALAYDPASGQWRAYDGGLLRWMKDQLAVSAR